MLSHTIIHHQSSNDSHHHHSHKTVDHSHKVLSLLKFTPTIQSVIDGQPESIISLKFDRFVTNEIDQDKIDILFVLRKNNWRYRVSEYQWLIKKSIPPPQIPHFAIIRS
ncbi:hypothetical protein [Dokdonia sp. Hel_I_53]|uniref:hypothetical protein n=1 Tax=Dokdonia sp. Hel_I_53 TaxID=1566287 RepID=UPI001198DDE0|nr:hypothetical protein [Dokdonia sp. Hel_I_53]TVZ52218.1 hypothetical protein OD90_1388 [Dokdonia sp. Hel_I_53]